MKTNKRALAMMTAAFMAITPLAATGLTAFAGATDSYTINVNESATGYSYKAYQIFAGNDEVKDGKTILSDIKWATGFNSAQFLTAIKNEAIFENAFASATTAEQVANILKDINDTDKLATFARLAKLSVTGEGTANSAQTSGKYPINVTGSGYYLVEETGIPAGNPAGQEEVYSRFMLDVVGNTEVNPKRDLPTLDKKITGPNARDGGKANGVSIGDAVSYEIDTDMPDTTGYEKYFYVINDTLAEGLTFDPTSVVVTIAGEEVDADVDYEVQTGPAADPYTFQIVFKDFVKRTEAKDSPIVVTYDAYLNENADRSTAGNLNTANLTYSNNPNKHYDGEPPTSDEPGDGDPTGKTPDKQTKTYTANIKLTKTDEDGNALTGAKFQISGTAAKAVMINGTSYVKDDNGSFYKLKDGTFTETDPNGNEDLYDGTDKYKEVKDIDKTTTYEKICKEAYVKADGTLEFGGLGAGTYTLTELVAPKGFNKLENPITVVIKDDGITFSSPAWTATKDGADIEMTDIVNVAFQIENKEGSTLPSTGGIGTKLFYLFGGILVAGSGVLLITKKRMTKEN